MKLNARQIGLIAGPLLIAAAAFLVQQTNPLKQEKPRKSSENIFTPGAGPIKLAEDFKFYYGIDNRFKGVPLHRLQAAVSIEDFLGDGYTAQISDYESVKLYKATDGKLSEDYYSSSNNILSEAQKDFFKTVTYGTDFNFDIQFFEQKDGYEEPIADRVTPYLTVVPAIETYYKPGQDELIRYLRENNEPNTLGLNDKDILPARIRFVVNTQGKVEDISVIEASGLPRVDLNLVQLLKNLPGEWEPARNAKGEKVAQPLVLFFGNRGC